MLDWNLGLASINLSIMADFSSYSFFPFEPLVCFLLHICPVLIGWFLTAEAIPGKNAFRFFEIQVSMVNLFFRFFEKILIFKSRNPLIEVSIDLLKELAFKFQFLWQQLIHHQLLLQGEFKCFSYKFFF
jgi:hypothetical protein